MERYFETRAEAEAAWLKFTPLANHPGQPAPRHSLLSESEVALFLEIRTRLKEAGISINDTVQLAILGKWAMPPTTATHEQPQATQPAALWEQIQRISSDVQTILDRLGRIENGTVAQGRVLRSIKEAARYCGFNNRASFLEWADRMGFAIPKTKIVRQQRSVFLISELEAAILRDPMVHRNRRQAIQSPASRERPSH